MIGSIFALFGRWKYIQSDAPIDILPTELFQRIFSFVPRGELYPALFVCKKWCHLIKDPQLMASRMNKLSRERLILGITMFQNEHSPKELEEAKEIVWALKSIHLCTQQPFNEIKELLHPHLVLLELVGMEVNSEDLKNLPVTLESLVVRGCRIERVCLESLPKGLKSLSIDNNNPNPLPFGHVIERPESDFEQIPESLESLEIGRPYKVSTYIISRLPEGLKSLSLRYQPTSDSDFSKMSCQLEQLDLASCSNISGSFLERFTHLTQLTLSEIREQVTDETIRKLPIQLRDLKLHHCFAITDAGIAILSCLTRLTTLSIENLCIHGTTMCHLPNSLTALNVIEDSHIFSDESGRSLTGLSQLASLNLEGYESLPYSNCKEFPTSLRSLKVNFVNHITRSLAFSCSGINRCSELQEVKLTGLSLDHERIPHLSNTLKTLTFHACQLDQRTNMSLMCLTRLSVVNLKKSTGVNLETFFFWASSLTELNVAGVTFPERLDVFQIYPKCRKLTASPGTVFTSQGTFLTIEQMKKKYPYMQINIDPF